MLRFTLATFLALGVLLPGQVGSQDLPPNAITTNAAVSPGDLPANPFGRRLPDPALEARFQRVMAKLAGYVQEPAQTLRQFPPSDTSVPARYARPEGSTGFLGQVDRYEYVKPAPAVVQGVPAEAGGSNDVDSVAPAAPANNGDEDVRAQ